MPRQDGFEALTEMMPVPANGGLEVDWPEVEAAWRLSFPPDYKEFLARYGRVTIENYLQVTAPTTVTPNTCDDPGAPLGGMGFITADARAMWVDTAPDGIDAEPNDVVVWGVASSADLFCWLTHGEPEDWTVTVFSHGDDSWTRYSYGMAEFLCRALRADPAVELMADTPLWGRQGPSFT